MNALVQLEKMIQDRSEKFLEYNNSAPSKLDFEQECLFARQSLMNNDRLCGVAAENQISLLDAIYNVASTGISLNPSRAHAYLVPRKVSGVRKVCLDISYRGLLKLATDTGVTKYMKAELVYENDHFEYRGFDQRPTLVANPFKDRGDLIGVYAMAVLHDDSILVENMTIEQVNAIRDDSEVYKGAAKYSNPSNSQHYKFKNCVWVKYYEEMVKKTVLKRAFKTLPETKGKEILDNAVDTINEHEGINFQEQKKESEIDYTLEQSEEYQRCLQDGDFVGLVCLKETMSVEAQGQMYDIHEKPNIPQGGIGKHTKRMEESEANARDLRESNLQRIIELCDIDDSAGISEIWDEAGQWERDWYLARMNSEQAAQVA